MSKHASLNDNSIRDVLFAKKLVYKIMSINFASKIIRIGSLVVDFHYNILLTNLPLDLNPSLLSSVSKKALLAFCRVSISDYYNFERS